MKKLIAIILVLAAALSLAACNSDSATHEQKKDDQETKFAPIERDPSEDSVLGYADFEGKVWENEMMGLGFRAEEDWYFASDDELIEMAGYTSDFVDEYTDIVSVAETFFDMAASDSDSRDNVNVTMEFLGDLQMDESDVYDYLDSQIELLREAYGKMNYEKMNFEHIIVVVDDTEFEGLLVEAEISDIAMEQIVFATIADNYLCSAAITAFDGVSAEDYLNNFYIL